MSIESIVLIISLAISLISLVMIILVYRSEKTIDKLRPYLKDIEELKEETAKEERKVLKEAMVSSRVILEEAAGEVRKILKLSRKIKKDVEEKVENALTESLSKAILTFQNASNAINSEYETKLREITQSQEGRLGQVAEKIEQEASRQMQSLGALVESQLMEIRKEEQSTVTKELESLRAQLQEYKNQKLKEVDQGIYQIIEKTAKIVIGKSLDLSLHQDLVLEALEQAKKEGIFNG